MEYEQHICTSSSICCCSSSIFRLMSASFAALDWNDLPPKQQQTFPAQQSPASAPSSLSLSFSASDCRSISFEQSFAKVTSNMPLGCSIVADEDAIKLNLISSGEPSSPLWAAARPRRARAHQLTHPRSARRQSPPQCQIPLRPRSPHRSIAFPCSRFLRLLPTIPPILPANRTTACVNNCLPRPGRRQCPPACSRRALEEPVRRQPDPPAPQSGLGHDSLGS